MKGTITEQLVSELSRVNSIPNQKENTTMATMMPEASKEMNENGLMIEQVAPIDINTQPFKMEVNDPKDPKDHDTTNSKPTTTRGRTIEKLEDRKNNKSNTTTKKETKTMTTPKSNTHPYSRFAYQDELAVAIQANDIAAVRDILSWGPAGKIADKVKDILYLHPNKERDEFLMAAARLLSLDYKLSDGSVNQEWIRLAASLIGKDELDKEGNVVRKANSKYNHLMDKAASELPLSKKLENGFISTMDCIGKGIAIVGAAGTGVVGNFIAQTIAASYRAKIEIEKTTLSAQIMDAIDPELIQLRATKAQIDALKKMAADAQDKSNESK